MNLSFQVSGSSPGTMVNIYRSSDGYNWTLSSPDSTCIIDANLMCQVRTDHLSYFAPVAITSPTSISTSANSGPGGGGYISSVFNELTTISNATN